jgi:hypothetical protein
VLFFTKLKKKSIKKFAIIGSGFGLYGYLPAIIKSKYKVILAEEYKKKIELRSDLIGYLKFIDWSSSKEISISEATSVAVAVPPEAQKNIINQILNRSNIKHIILEKPLCPSPKDSIELLKKISKTKKQFRISYIFLLTDWYNTLKKINQIKNIKISIKWFFKADHIRNKTNTWKKHHYKGGGPLRFYGIHLISVLASLGYNTTISSSLINKINISTGWIATFSKNDNQYCEIQLQTDSNLDEFIIEITNIDKVRELIYSNKSPLKMQTAEFNELDSRVTYLKKLIDTFNFHNDKYLKLYKKINNLWNSAELKLIVK